MMEWLRGARVWSQARRNARIRRSGQYQMLLTAHHAALADLGRERTRVNQMREELIARPEPAGTPHASGAEVERLARLIEECGRVAMAAGIVLRFGWDGVSPFGVLSNRNVLEREIGRYRCALDALLNAGDVRQREISTWRQKLPAVRR